MEFRSMFTKFKAMDDIGVVMTPLGDVVTAILVVKVARGNDKN